MKKYNCPNLYSQKYKLKESFVNSVVLQMESIEDVSCFIDTFKNLEIVSDVSEDKNLNKIVGIKSYWSFVEKTIIK